VVKCSSAQAFLAMSLLHISTLPYVHCRYDRYQTNMQINVSTADPPILATLKTVEALFPSTNRDKTRDTNWHGILPHFASPPLSRENATHARPLKHPPTFPNTSAPHPNTRMTHITCFLTQLSRSVDHMMHIMSIPTSAPTCNIGTLWIVL
jgi:hypothetical protein